MGGFRAVAGMATLLDDGRGRIGEAVQAARVRGAPMGGMGALHLAAGKGRLEVCRYLVEELRLDVDDADQEGPSLILSPDTKPLLFAPL